MDIDMIRDAWLMHEWSYHLKCAVLKIFTVINVILNLLTDMGFIMPHTKQL